VKLQDSITRRRLAAIAAVLPLEDNSPSWQGCAPRRRQRAGKFPEELFMSKSEDDIVNGSAIFVSPKKL
jgi:hypothetical protein